MIGEIRTRWRIFFYNLIKRHWCDWRYRRMYGPTMVKSGKVSREEYEFVENALRAAKELDRRNR